MRIVILNMKKALVMGAGGFIGSHLVEKLKNDRFWVRGVDLKKPEFSKTNADNFIIGDLRDPHLVKTRSFLYIDECLEGIRRLMDSEFLGPVNIGSEEMISINGLAEMVMDVAGKSLTIKHIKGPLGVRGRNSDNNLIFEKLGWKPQRSLREGIEKTYTWICQQVDRVRLPSTGTKPINHDNLHRSGSVVSR